MAPRSPSTERLRASAASSIADPPPSSALTCVDLDLLQRVDDVLEDVVVKVAGDPVALGLPDLAQAASDLLRSVTSWATTHMDQPPP